jgi:hypothetical protein
MSRNGMGKTLNDIKKWTKTSLIQQEANDSRLRSSKSTMLNAWKISIIIDDKPCECIVFFSVCVCVCVCARVRICVYECVCVCVR